MIDISVGIRETKKRHSIDGPDRPRLRGNRRRHHAQAQTPRTNLPEAHFECPLFLQAMTCLYRTSCGSEQAGAPWLCGDRQRFISAVAQVPQPRRSGYVRAAVKGMMWRRLRLPAKAKIADLGFEAFDLKPPRPAGGDYTLLTPR